MNIKLKEFHKIVAYLLAFLLVFESFGIYVSAAETDYESVDKVICEGGTGDGVDVSDNDASEGDGAYVGDTIDGEDVLANTTANEVIFASGTYYGMDWTINTDGLLKIEGKYNSSNLGRSWSYYASGITAVKVTATDVGSTYKWFADLTALKTVDLRGFDSGKLLDASYMFSGCSALESIQFGSFKTYNIKDMSYMFYGCNSLKKIDLSSFNTSKVINMRYMFAKCASLTQIDVSGFDTSKVTDMTGMFYGCSLAKNIKTGGFDTGNVTDMSAMFEGCRSMEWARVGNFNTAKVVNMSSMFQDCTRLVKLNVTGFKTSNVKYMSAMFSGCTSLSTINLDNFNTVSVTSMSHMFSDCQSLTKIDLSDFKTYSVTDMDGMFFKCFQLENLDLGSFSMAKVASADAMLGRCGSLRQLVSPTNLKIAVELPFEMKTSDGERHLTLPQNKTTSVKFERITYDIDVISDQVYTGSAIKPVVTVKKDDVVLVQGVDYSVSYRNNKKVASATSENAPTVIVKGKGHFSGSITRTFDIVAKEITEENAVIEGMVWPQNGKAQKKIPVITVDGRKLKAKKDFLAIFGDGAAGAYTKPGTYKVTIKGIGNYTGEITTSLVILGDEQIQASELFVSKIPACAYVDGKPATPEPKVKYKGKLLIRDVDYELIYKNNDKAGTATVIIRGLQNAESQYIYGTVEKKFKINGTHIRNATANYTTNITYTGYGIYPKVEMTMGDTVLVPDKDYKVEYLNNVNVGKGKIIITGCGGYTGVVHKTFRISPDVGVGDLLDIRMVDEDGVVAYTKNGTKPKVVVSLNGQLLQEDVDYKLSYKYHTKIASADAKKPPTIIVKGRGNYSFTRKVYFSIEKKMLDADEISISVKDVVRTAKDLRSKPILTDENGAILTSKKDYEIVGYTIGGVAYNKNNIPADATRGIVTIKGIGYYTGEVSVMYRITDKSIRDVQVWAKDLEYTGEAAEYTPELIAYGMLVLKDPTTGKELVCGEDYEILGYNKNTKRGKAAVIIKGLGDYGGTRNVGFRIVKQRLDG